MKHRKKAKSKLREQVEAVLLALLIALGIRGFVIDHYLVPTGSMVPTIGVGDRLFALKFFYGARIPFTKRKLPGLRSPLAGDIVVFQSPFYRQPALLIRILHPAVHTLSFGFLSMDGQARFYVKRCIGVPGDVVRIVGKRVYINGELQRGWWPEFHGDSTIIPPGNDLIRRRDYFGPITVPEGGYFMMGDNRDESYDSRFWGFVDVGDIYGRAVFTIWPLRDAGILR